MSGFTASQLKALLTKLDRARVQSREIGGRQIDYIEGWFAIAEANAIFGFAGWDREMAQFERVFERVQGKTTNCGYLARVRIRVRARGTVVVREGTGFGHASALTPDEAHERALKAAETDATKRALATFGNRFGLALYDKDQAGIGTAQPTTEEPSDTERKQTPAVSEPGTGLVLKTDDGKVLAAGLSPEAYCSSLRQMIEASRLPHEVEGLRTHNEPTIAVLRETVPALKTARGTHYADILDALMDRRWRTLAEEEATEEPAKEPDTAESATALPPVTALPSAETNEVETPAPPQTIRPSRLAAGPAIDKSVLAISSPRRVRNKAHLVNVAGKPCLICEGQPCHAHHITFAQPRGLSVKVSDEYTVPLCVLHHNEVHRTRPEEAWWRKYGFDPLREALLLWQESLGAVLSGNPGPGEGSG